MVADQRMICRSGELDDSGDGVRFEVVIGERKRAAFAIRYLGEAHAYLNCCTHLPYELDWNPGKFFDRDGLVLICSVHGATYDPATGRCIGGPCRGGLRKVPIHEHDGGVFLADSK